MLSPFDEAPLDAAPLDEAPRDGSPLDGSPRDGSPLDQAHEAPASGTEWRSPALDVVTIDRATADGYRVVLPDGEQRLAALGPGVEAALAEQCLREQQPMLVRRGGDGLLLIGALQTRVSPVVSRDGVVTVSGRHVRVEAERHLELEVGASRVALGRDGKLAAVGERLTMHLSSLIKLIASKVELP